MAVRCPGRDTLYWKPEDVFETPCPACGRAVEFFKDDVTRKCKNCGHKFPNPRLDMGCAEWCPYAEKCLGEIGHIMKPEPSRRDKGE